MRLVGTALLGLALLFTLLANVEAQGDKGKEVTLKGKITCAKCDLGVTKGCATVIVTKKDGKDVVFYFDKAGHKANHKEICTSPMDGSVTGVVSKEGDKNIITVKEVKFKK
jgi:hypothetical protein